MLRLLLPLTIFFLFDLYVFEAIRLVSRTWTTAGQYLGYGLYWAIPVLAIILLLSRIYPNLIPRSKKIFSHLRSTVFIAYFGKFLMAGVLLLDDLRRMVLSFIESVGGGQNFHLDRSMLNAELALAMGLVPFVLLVYGMIRNPYRYKVFREQVFIKNLPEALRGLRIVQISDIHSGSFTQREPVKESIRLINAEKPDLVFFTGDLVNSAASEMIPYMDIFDKIESRYGVFSILGNHDYGDYHAWKTPEDKRENFRQLIQTHRDLGWDLLLNENRILTINGAQLAVIGVENYSASSRFHKYGDLSKAYAGTTDTNLKLLLSHDPSHWDDEVINKYKDIALTFSGHTHGMQFGIEIPGWWSWSPIKYIYKNWAGLYQIDQQYLYVNRGLGFLGYPGRVGILPEVTVIDLEKG